MSLKKLADHLFGDKTLVDFKVSLSDAATGATPDQVAAEILHLENLVAAGKTRPLPMPTSELPADILAIVSSVRLGG